MKNHLSEYLRWVEEGEETLVERRQVPVARIVPARKGRGINMEGVSWNGARARGGRKRPRIKGKSLAEQVLEERR
ncbi:MAG TPA: type II toxin-antitoxin system Phd/YefM family antitoxin [Thiolapillus brandeum]|uniref:Type II toxin-antitoxin system Phd/YefM family antitoxin n=1 Tax=Thiolapillus brandeum TaxID=1076588 RepID=A0A7C5MYW2_9GAMM|nr:type II toxin-antitoxin system Phd/YefM family antitoxin [Thiolapillus brandeum]